MEVFIMSCKVWVCLFLMMKTFPITELFHSASFSSPFPSLCLVWESIKLWCQVLDRISAACRVLSFHFLLYACIPQKVQKNNSRDLLTSVQ